MILLDASESNEGVEGYKDCCNEDVEETVVELIDELRLLFLWGEEKYPLSIFVLSCLLRFLLVECEVLVEKLGFDTRICTGGLSFIILTGL